MSVDWAALGSASQGARTQSGPVDWGAIGRASIGPSSGGGGVDWGSVASASPIHVAKSAGPKVGGGGGGGHSFFSSVPGGGLLSGAEKFLTNVGQGVYGVGHAAVVDVANHPASLLSGPVAPLDANLASILEGKGGGQLVKKVAEPIGQAYAQKYGPIFQHPLTGKSYAGVRKDPFGTALDALTLATAPFTGGESAILRGASLGEKLGAVGDLGTLQRIAQLPKAERAAALARAGRTGLLDRAYVAASANKLPIIREAALGGKDSVMMAPYTIDPARTPWGRFLQGRYHSLLGRPGIADTALGAGRFVQREGRQFVAQAEVPGQLAIRKYRESIPLGAPEHVAQQVAAEAPRGIAREHWLQHRIDFYKGQVAGATGPERTDLQAKLHQLGADNPRRFAKVQNILANPSPRFLRFYERGRQLSQETSRAIGTPAIDRAARAELPADVMAGMRWQGPGSERIASTDPFATDRAAMTREARRAQTEVDQAQARLTSVRERVRIHESRLTRPGDNATGAMTATASQARKALDTAEQTFRDAKQRRDFLTEGLNGVPAATPAQTIRTEGGFVGPTSKTPGVFDAYKPATETAATNPFGANYIYSHLGPNRQALGGRAVLSRSNMPLGDSVKAPDVGKLNRALRLTTGRHFTNPDVLTRAGVQAFRWATANDFRTWLKDYARAVPEDGRIPQGWRAVIDKPPRDVMERQTLLDHAMATHAQKDLLSEYWKRVLPKGDTTGAQLMVPESLARSVEREFKSNGALLRVLDKGNDLWRYSVLKARPAWALRNIASQHFLYHLHNLSPAGLVNLFHVMRPEWTPAEAQTFAQRLTRMPAFRSQFSQELEHAGVAGVHTGSASLLRGTSGYGAPGRIAQFSEAHPTMMRVPSGAKKMLLAPGNFNQMLNQRLADDLPRMAQFRRDLMRSGARVRAQSRMLAVAKETDQGISLMRRLTGPKPSDVFREATPEELAQIARQGQRVLGNWSTLAPWERRYVRRVVPFYQFFKTMTGIVGHMAADNPERMALLNALTNAAQQNPSILPAGPMPSWLRGAIGLGPASGGIQPIVAMQTTNHFNAPAQFAAALGGLAGIGRQTDANGLLGPLPDMLFYAEGINPTTGTAYKGTGANLTGLPRAFAAELGGLPQVSLAQQYLAGTRIPGTNTRIGGQYPSKIYANSRTDNLLNYLLGPYKRVRLAQAATDAKEGR